MVTIHQDGITGFDLKGVSLDKGMFQTQFRQMCDYYLALPNDSLLVGFRRRHGGNPTECEMGGWYSNDCGSPDVDETFHTFGQWLSAFARIYSVTSDERFLSKLRYLIREWAACMEEDGYFYYSNRCNAYHYVYEKMVCGLVDSYLYAGLEEALVHLERITNWAIVNLGRLRIAPLRDGANFVGGSKQEENRDNEWYTLSENLYRAYLLTGKEKYKTFAEVWHHTPYWNALRHKEGGYLAGLHGYSHVNTLSGAAMAYKVTGEASYLVTIQNAYLIFKDRQFMASGGYAPGEMLVAENDTLADAIEKTANNSFEVPCGSWAGFKLSKYLMELTGDSEYGNWAETLLYNAIGASLPMKDDEMRRGKTFYYADYRLKGGRKVYNGSSYPCCSGTYPQVVTEYHNMVYFHDTDNLYVNLFLPSRVEHNNGLIVQETDFPVDNTTRFTFVKAPSSKCTLRLRVPAWVKTKQRQDIQVAINSMRCHWQLDALNWLVIDHPWQQGDLVAVRFPMSLWFHSVDTAHPKQVTLMYGPVMLAAEGYRQDPLCKDAENPDTWLSRKNAASLTFEGVNAEGGTLRFRPFYTFAEREPYTVQHTLI